MNLQRVPLIAAALFVVFAAFYAALATSHFIGGDHVIFAHVGLVGGYAHAPGYPIFSWLSRIFVALIPTSAIHATSLGTTFLAALSIPATFRALVAWGIGPAASAIAAAMFGALPHVVFIHTQAEVFALNHLMIALILWASAPNVFKSGPLGGGVLAFLAGLALSHHHTAVFMAPIGLLAFGRLAKQGPTLAVLGTGAVGLALGLSPYGYLPYVGSQHPTPWHWGDPTTAQGLLDIFLRRDFGTLSMTVAEGEQHAGVLVQWTHLLKNTAVGLGFAGAGLWTLRKQSQAPFWAFLGSALLAGPLFVALFHREPTGLNELLVDKFHLMFAWQLCVLSAFALDRFLTRPPALLLAGVALFATSALAVIETRTLQDDAPSRYIHDLWMPLPDNAVLIATGDHATAGSWRFLAEEHPKRYTVAADLLAHRWYRDHVNQDLGIQTTHQGQKVDLHEVVRAIQATGRPVFMTSMLDPTLARAFPTQPLGLTIAVGPPGSPQQHPMAVAAQNIQIYENFTYLGPDGHHGPWASILPETYAATWVTLEGAFRAFGDTTSAAQAAAMAARFSTTETP